MDHGRRVQARCSAAGSAIAPERDDRRMFKGRVRSMNLSLRSLSALAPLMSDSLLPARREASLIEIHGCSSRMRR
jgi:hypothetical protein